MVAHQMSLSLSFTFKKMDSFLSKHYGRMQVSILATLKLRHYPCSPM